MKLYIIHMLSILLMIGAGKEIGDTPGVYEEKAIEILKETSEAFKSHDALFMEFVYIPSSSSMNLYDDSKGFMYVSGDKYYIKTGDMHFISDGVLTWTFLEDVNEVHISYLEDTEGAITPLSLLENFEEEFKSLWLRQEIYDDGELIEIIDLVPVEHHPFKKYRLAISSQSRHIVYTIAYDSHGGTYTYLITDTIIDPEIPGGLFSFNPEDHPGIEVVDLR